MSARVLLAGQLAQMRAWGFDVSVISAPGPDLDVVRDREGVEVVPVPMAREMSPARDGRSLAEITLAIRRLRPDIINAGTPKAGFLASIAAATLRVPVRIYLLHGLRLETEAGTRRAVLRTTERIAAACAHEVIAVSPSLRDAFLGERLAPSQKVRALSPGSPNGIDTQHFARTAALRENAAEVRRHHGIAKGALVLGFIGRLAKDKGITDLLDAFEAIRRRNTSVRLIIVSADLSDEVIDPEAAARIPNTPGVILVPRVDDVRPYLCAMDVLAFPSLREGLPSVVLEASALELPVVGYNVTGVRDAVVDGVSGVLVRPRDVVSFGDALQRYLEDRDLSREHGQAGRIHARAFERSTIWHRWALTYVTKLEQADLDNHVRLAVPQNSQSAAW